MDITNRSVHQLNILLCEQAWEIIKNRTDQNSFVVNAISYLYDTSFDKYNFDYENVLETYQEIILNHKEFKKHEVVVSLNDDQMKKLIILHHAFGEVYYLSTIINTAINIYTMSE